MNQPSYKCNDCFSIYSQNDLRELLCPACGGQLNVCSPVSLQSETQKTISFAWIDRQMAYLTSRIGLYRLGPGDTFFFEPTPGFYGYIGQGTTDCLNEALKMLARHIKAHGAPIIEEWKGSSSPLISSDYDWTNDKQPPGVIHYSGSGRSRIEINMTNKHSPFIMGAILAHELTHHFLDSLGIRLPDEKENEKLTDLATAYIGLGKLTLNGYDPITWTQQGRNGPITWTYRVGYLSSEDMAAIVYQICQFRNIPLPTGTLNLSEKSKNLMKKIQSVAEDFNRKKRLIGEQQCMHCGQYAFFDFNKQDDGLYCSKCGWEYSDGLKYTYKKRNSPLRRISNFIKNIKEGS